MFSTPSHRLTSARRRAERIPAVDLRATGLREVRGTSTCRWPFPACARALTNKVHAAALPGGLQNLGGSGFQAVVGVRDHELHPTQPRSGERAQEFVQNGAQDCLLLIAIADGKLPAAYGEPLAVASAPVLAVIA